MNKITIFFGCLLAISGSLLLVFKNNLLIWHSDNATSFYSNDRYTVYCYADSHKSITINKNILLNDFTELVYKHKPKSVLFNTKVTIEMINLLCLHGNADTIVINNNYIDDSLMACLKQTNSTNLSFYKCNFNCVNHNSFDKNKKYIIGYSEFNHEMRTILTNNPRLVQIIE